MSNEDLKTSPDEMNTKRKFGPFLQGILTVLSAGTIIVAIIYIFGIVAFGQTILEIGYLYLLLAMLMPLTFLIFPAHPRQRDSVPWFDILFSILCFLIPVYFFFHSEAIALQGWEFDAPLIAYIFALIFWALILEGSRRTVGLFFCIFLFVFSIYPLFGHLAPGMFHSGSFTLRRIACYHIMSQESAMGLPLLVLGTLFIGFLLFACTLMSTGAAQAFLGLAMALFGNVRGAPAKVAIVASSLVATVTGGPMSNIMIVGPITIPMMVRGGYPSHYAAAIEACASTGGVIMPPVMGAVAFVMASFLGISYLQVCIASLVPAIFYYIGLYVQVDAYAAKKGIKGIPKSELPKLTQALKEMSIFAAAVVVLLFLLAYLRRDVQAPFYTLLFLLGANMLRKKTRLGLRGFIALLQNAGRLLAELAPIMAGIGFVLGSLMVTGVAQSLSSEIIGMAGGNVVLLVVLGGICSFILGMGLTVTACYVLLAILLAPALIKGGLDVLAVHFFIMYCGMLSYITPPVAIGAYAAASLAGTNAMRTGYTAMRLGLIIFLMPFFFVFNPAFILRAPLWEIISVVGTGTLGIIMICSAIEGYLVMFGVLSIIPRLIVAFSGFLFLLPQISYAIVGTVIMVSLIFISRIVQNREKSKIQVE